MKATGAPAAFERRIVVAILGASWFAFAWPLLGDGVPYYRDILETNAPIGSFIGDSLRAGRLPQWYPFDGLGLQLIGNADGLFHPFVLAHAWSSDTLGALKVQIGAAYLTGLIGAYLLCRRLTGARVPALCGATLFALSGYAISLQSNLAYLVPYHSMPWAVLAGTQLVTGSRPWAWVVVVASTWASVLLAGDPQAFGFVGVGLVALVIERRQWQRAAPLAVAGLLAAGSCAVWLVPAKTLLDESVRQVWSANGSYMALRFARLPELVLGGLWRDAGEEMVLKSALDGGKQIWATSVFFGATGFLVIILGVRLRSLAVFVWASFGVLLIWLSTGDEGGLHPALRAVVSPVARFRYPEKFLGGATLCLSIAAAYGVRLALDVQWRQLAAPLLIAAGLGLVAAGAVIAWPPDTLSSNMARDLMADWAMGLGSTLGFAALAIAAVSYSRSRPRAAWLVPVVISLELLLAGHTLMWLAPRQAFAQRPLFCRAADANGVGLGKGRVITVTSQFAVFYSGEDGASWLPRTLNTMEPGVAALCGFESIALPRMPGLPLRLFYALKSLERPRIGDLFNGVVQVIDTPTAPSADVVAVDGPIALQRAAYARPRAYAATPRWVTDGAAALEQLRSLPDTEAIVEGTAPQGDWTVDGSERVEVSRYEADDVVLRTVTHGPRMIVLNDLAAPGWTASVDGVATEILRANYLVRAVAVPPGSHEIAFSFAVPGLAAGARISALSLVAGLVILVVELRKNRARVR